MVSPPLSNGFNGNETVGATDLSLGESGFGATGSATRMRGDADGDLDVDGADFLVWQQQLGSSAPAIAANGPVPEPATSLLLVVAAAGICCMGGRMRQELVMT